MNIADLFVKIALSGATDVNKGLTGISKGMSGLVDGSLAAKAAVAGVIFGLERLTGFASQAGMDLKKFNLMTGESTDELQQWQYAFMKVDVSAQETQSAVEGVKGAIANMRLGKGAPEAMGFIGIDAKKADDVFYVMSKLEGFAKRMDVPAAVRANLLSTFGLSSNVIQGLMTMNREADHLSRRQIISPAEIDRLARINSAWKDFWFTLRTFGIKEVAAHGMEGVQELSKAFKFLFTEGDEIQKLVKQFPILQAVAVAAAIAIAAAFAPVTTAIAGLLYMLAEIQKYRETGGETKNDKNGVKHMVNREDTWQDTIMNWVTGSNSGMTNGGGRFGHALGGFGRASQNQAEADLLNGKMVQRSFESMKPAGLPLPYGGAASVPGATNVPREGERAGMKAEVHIYGVEHPHETASEAKRGITDAARQLNLTGAY